MIGTIITVLIVYLLYFFVSVLRYDKNGHLKNKAKGVSDYDGLPSEVKYFIKRYNVDLEKVNLRGLLKLTGFILGIDITIISLIVVLFFRDSVVLQIVIAAVFIIPIYLVSLKLLGNYFKKKGLVKNV